MTRTGKKHALLNVEQSYTSGPSSAQKSKYSSQPSPVTLRTYPLPGGSSSLAVTTSDSPVSSTSHAQLSSSSSSQHIADLTSYQSLSGSSVIPVIPTTSVLQHIPTQHLSGLRGKHSSSGTGAAKRNMSNGSIRPKNIKFLPSMLVLINDNLGPLVRIIKHGATNHTYLCVKNNDELVGSFDYSDKPHYMKLQNLTRQYSDYGFRKIAENSQIPPEIMAKLADMPKDHFEDFYVNENPSLSKFNKFWSYIINNKDRVEEVRQGLIREGRFKVETAVDTKVLKLECGDYNTHWVNPTHVRINEKVYHEIIELLLKDQLVSQLGSIQQTGILPAANLVIESTPTTATPGDIGQDIISAQQLISTSMSHGGPIVSASSIPLTLDATTGQIIAGRSASILKSDVPIIKADSLTAQGGLPCVVKLESGATMTIPSARVDPYTGNIISTGITDYSNLNGHH